MKNQSKKLNYLPALNGAILCSGISPDEINQFLRYAHEPWDVENEMLSSKEIKRKLFKKWGYSIKRKNIVKKLIPISRIENM